MSEVDSEAASVRIRAVVDQHTGDGPYVPRQAAGEIVEKLRHNEPDVLAAWLDSYAEHFIWQMINDRDRSRRSKAAHVGKSSAFRASAEAHETGDPLPLRRFLDAPYTVADGSRRRLGDLRRADLLHVAGDYDRRARENAMRSAFMTALAKKVNNGTVAEHFDEAQLSRMWTSLAA